MVANGLCFRRSGAVVLKDIGGKVIATKYFYGAGIGSQMVFTQGTEIPVGDGGKPSPGPGD